MYVNLTKPLYVSFLLSTVSLKLFCIVFGVPVLSKVASEQVLYWAGCSSAGFDTQAKCPPGSFAEPFIPLSHWFTTFMSPLILLRNFGALLLGWALLSCALWVAWLSFRTANQSNDDRNQRL
jgi:hypothetical protein